MGKRTKGFICALAMLAPAIAPAADDDSMQRRIDELERQLEEQQRKFSDEIEQLKRRVEQQPQEQKEAPRVEEVERKQGILTEELRRLREALVLPETKELKSAYGLGPAASKVYGVQRGLSIGGYGEFNFDNEVSDKTGADSFDFVRFVLYLGYKFNDWIVLNSELEFEHGTTSSNNNSSGGSVSVEFATLDFLLHPIESERERAVQLLIHDLGDLSYMIEKYARSPSLLARADAMVERQLARLRGLPGRGVAAASSRSLAARPAAAAGGAAGPIRARSIRGRRLRRPT